MPDLKGQTPQQCPQCRKLAIYVLEDRCRACYFPAALLAPNVRIAGHAEQSAALEERYQAACEQARRQGTTVSLQRLQRLAERTQAVVNVSVGLALDLFFHESMLYSSYETQVKARTRAPNFEHDRQQRLAGTLLYGSYGDKIVYAVLSVDGRGLSSYGPVHLQLDDVTVAYRATVLEENSYHFLEQHGLTLGKPLPPGYIAPWAERGKLAVTKLVDKLEPELDDEACSALLLENHTEQRSNGFLEAHIYGWFNYQAVGSVGFSARPITTLQAEVQDLQIKALRNRLETLAVPWREM